MVDLLKLLLRMNREDVAFGSHFHSGTKRTGDENGCLPPLGGVFAQSRRFRATTASEAKS
jgi:hypothetical protein